MEVLRTFTQEFTTPGDLGRLIGDPERTLPGEDPSTGDALAARHWAAVHAELLEVRLDLLEQLRRAIGHVSDPAVRTGLRHNARALELAVNRSRRRVAFWAHRLGELADAFAAPSRA